MAELPESAEATPILPGASDPVTDEVRLEASLPGPSEPVETAGPGAGDAPGKPAHARWRGPLALATALATASAVVALGPAEEPPLRAPVATQPVPEPGHHPPLVQADQPVPEPEPMPQALVRPARDGLALPADESSRGAPSTLTPPRRPRDVAGASPATVPRRPHGAPFGRPPATGTRPAVTTGSPESHGVASPPPPADVRGAVATALARYQAGDLEGARAALATAAGDPEAAATAARLDAIARLLGPHEAWPPPGGAAALERLLELESALGLPHPSPLAVRAHAALVEPLVRKGGRLADEGRWEEAAAAFRAAQDHVPDQPAARAGLERVEQGAEALYLEGYLLEDENVDDARRIYRRVLRLARPGGSLARRVAARLAALSGSAAPAGSGE